MNPHLIFNQLLRTARRNSPVILTGLGITGVLSTAYLTGKATVDAVRMVDLEDERLHMKGQVGTSTKEKFKRVWKLYVPAAASGVVTIACIVGGTHVGLKRTAAAYSLLTASEKAYEEYKDKVAEQLGERKEQSIRDSIAQDRVANAPVGLVIGSGPVFCHEMFTDRIFMSDMETLRKAENTINAKLVRQIDVSLDDFYHLIGLETTSASGYQGWSSDRMMELRFSTVLRESRPCLSFDYNYIHPF